MQCNEGAQFEKLRLSVFFKRSHRVSQRLVQFGILPWVIVKLVGEIAEVAS